MSNNSIFFSYKCIQHQVCTNIEILPRTLKTYYEQGKLTITIENLALTLKTVANIENLPLTLKTYHYHWKLNINIENCR